MEVMLSVDYNAMIFVFFVGIISPLFLCISDMIFGNSFDGRFSENYLKKMTVPKNSLLRKIMPFKELKGSIRPTYLYIRIIPFMFYMVLFIVSIIMFVVDQVLIDYISNNFFCILGFISGLIYVLYTLLMVFLTKWL